MVNMSGKIYIIGIGPGASEYLTKKAIDTVKASDYTVGSTRAIELFDDVNNKIAFNVKELLDKLEEGVQLACHGNVVSILSTGDPGFSGVLNTVLRISSEKGFDKENIEVIRNQFTSACCCKMPHPMGQCQCDDLSWPGKHR